MTEAVKATAPGRAFPCPDWMNDDQRELWRETVKHAPRNLLARVDAGVLVTYVVHRYAFESMAAMCQGRAVDLARMAKPLSEHQSAMLKASQVLGLDPSSRARLRVDSPIESPSKTQSNLFEKLKEA